jgi:hypothetical protein
MFDELAGNAKTLAVTAKVSNYVDEYVWSAVRLQGKS